MRRNVLALCGLVLATVIGPGAEAATADLQGASRPNIVFIVMDDVGIDQMRTFGYTADNQPRTPVIDTIAQAGVRFRNAWTMPECSPSRVSFFTGRYPLRTGVLNVAITRDLANSQMSPFEATTPKVLRQRGYKSGYFGKWHLTEVATNDSNGNPNPGNPSGNAAPRDMGWDAYVGTLEGGVDPVSWTPHGWGGKERPRCRRAIGRTRRSSGSGSSSWCGRAEHLRSWRGSSSPRRRRSGTG